MEFKLIVDSNFEIAETPMWDYRIGKLYFTDLFTGDIHRIDPKTGEKEVWKTNAVIGSAMLTTDKDKLLCALDSGIYLFDLINGKFKFICNPDNNCANRYNDTRIDPVGRIFTSSVSMLYGTDKYRANMLGSFYMIDTDSSIVEIEKGINQYNAIVWNKDATKMFVVDTFNECLIEYDYDIEKGPISQGRTVIRFEEHGMPDGMSIDVEDNIYVCHWTGKISVWNENMELIETVFLPVEYACCTGFGGDNFDDLYLATAKYGYTEEQLKTNKGAGGLFCAKSNIKGRGDYFYNV